MTCSTDAPHGPAAAPRPGFRGGWIPTQRTPGPTGSGQAPPPAGQRPELLTDRDLELVRHLAHGRSTAQIAAAMSVSSNTVRTRIRRVSGKLVVAGRYEIVAAARVLGLA